VLTLAPSQEPVPGYQLVHFLGKGGSGEVWKATGPGGVPVALKFIPAALRFQDLEQRALDLIKGIRHPNLIALFGSWLIDDCLVIGMELADQTLLDRHKQAVAEGLPGIPAPELLGYFADAARGVDFLNGCRHPHPRGAGKRVSFQHRDIKPQNLLLVSGGVKVGDWGLIRMLEDSVDSHSGPMTPAFAPPEFFAGKLSSRSDQYSLAVSYYYLRTGRLPFADGPGSTPSGRALDLGLIPVDGERQALARALAKGPRQRWADCRSFVEALRAAVPAEGRPSPAEASSRGPGQDVTVSQILKKPRRAAPVLDVPCFHFGSVVPPPFFIDREQELAEAKRILAGCHSFLIVGNRRSGKTSFCNKLIHDLMARPANKLLATHLDLQFCPKLTIETFLEHTLLNMIGEIARWVFGCKYDDLFRPDPTAGHPGLQQDAVFDSFVNIFRLITHRTHTRDNVEPAPLRPQEFVHFHNALRDIVRARGWSNFVVFFDEANRLPRDFSVDLLISNEQALSLAGVISVYVASPEMADSFRPLRESFGRELRLGPFRSIEDMRRLLARYYFDDAGKVEDLPAAGDALQLLWDTSRGEPYLIQLLAERSFSAGHDQGARKLKGSHVKAAYEALKAERRLNFPGGCGGEG
jgi:serine/threonine protein kinase